MEFAFNADFLTEFVPVAPVRSRMHHSFFLPVLLNAPLMSTDMLGDKLISVVSMVQCCLTSTETVRLIRTEIPGRPPRLSHSSRNLAESERSVLGAWYGSCCAMPGGHCLNIYNTIQLYCLCVQKFAFWLVIYIKAFNKVNNKTSTIYIKTFNKINNKTSTTR